MMSVIILFMRALAH